MALDSGEECKRERMALDNAKAIAIEAWSQLQQSIIAYSPPSDMSREYYHTFPGTIWLKLFPGGGFSYVYEQLKRLEIYKYKLGTENIQARMKSSIHYKGVRETEHKSQQGIEHIQESIRSSKHSEVVQAYEDQYEQGIEHVRDCMRSDEQYEVVRVNENGNQQGMEHIQGCMRSNERSEIVQANEHGNQQGIEYIRPCMRSNERDEVVRVNEHEIQLGIEHVQGCMRSNERYEMVQENEYGYKQGMEYIRPCMRSNECDEVVPGEYENHLAFNDVRKTVQSAKFPRAMQGPKVLQEPIDYMQVENMSILFDELLELVENRDQHVNKKPIMWGDVLILIKLLHHYGIDTIRIGVEEELKDVNQKCNNTKNDPTIQYKKKGLEVMLRICDAEACQKTLSEMIGKAAICKVLYK